MKAVSFGNTPETRYKDFLPVHVISHEIPQFVLYERSFVEDFAKSAKKRRV